jgi:hypothetical protein
MVENDFMKVKNLLIIFNKTIYGKALFGKYLYVLIEIKDKILII